ncbi:MAG: c-type cytochrome biogenesis protein CcmI [Hyphomicrobiaceae bacterium]|nr:c-type cytochrome biogenesis protein CcmI [Hyphomicrobiaceae bacterium]
MLLWIGFAVVTAAVVAVLVRPLMSQDREAATDDEANLAVYRHQLREIDSDLERGLITSGEAQAARTELGRRILRMADRVDPTAGELPVEKSHSAQQRNIVSRFAVYGAAALLPLVSIAVYLAVGAPELPGLPHAERLQAAKESRSVDELVGLVETRLRAKPDDGEGWDVIAPVYMRLQRFADATQAYASAIKYLGETERRLAGFAEAAVLANNGLIIPPARKAYERLAAMNPARPEPKFWLATAKEQDGDLAGARADLEAMIASAPADVPWRKLVETRIAELGAKIAGGNRSLSSTANVAAPSPDEAAKGTPASGASAAGTTTSGPLASSPSASGSMASGGTGPTAADVAAASQMTEVQRLGMINDMVSRLAKRLDANGADLEGWKRLAQAYKVLGRDGDARAALAKARHNFRDDAAALQSLDELASALGLKS